MEKMAISVSEAAELLGVSVPTAYTLVRRGDFPAMKVGTRTLVNVKQLQAWLDKQTSTAEQGQLT